MRVLLDTHILLWMIGESRSLSALTTLPTHHRDPFDRMLLAQAKSSGMKILSHDNRFPAYGDFVIAV